MIKLTMIVVSASLLSPNQIEVQKIHGGKYTTMQDCEVTGMLYAKTYMEKLQTRQAVFTCDKDLPWEKK